MNAYIFFTLLGCCILFFIMPSIFVVAIEFNRFFIVWAGLDARLGLDVKQLNAQLAPIFPAAALGISAIVAIFGLYLNRLNSEEPWLIIFREIHRDFWHDDKIAKAREWLCCDESYKELEEVLTIRLQNDGKGQILPDQYQKLETLDRLCALMLRIVNVNALQGKMPRRQEEAWRNLGYNWWLVKFKERGEDANNKVYAYTQQFWPGLFDAIKEAELDGAGH